MYGKFRIFLLMSILTYSVFSVPSSKEYGLLTVEISGLEVCRGPKRKDCCEAIVKVDRGILMTFNMRVMESFTLTNGKIVATSNGKEMMKFQMKSPCEHFLIKSLFHRYYNITENCVISKGHYVHTANVQEISEKYYGGKYFYGNWTFKSQYYGNNCNFFCMVMDVAMVPKKKV